jgi:uncharacterized protein (TIGR00255 family)
MIRSMTGYGEAEREIEAGRVRVEIKTLNHRFLNTHLRTPPGLDRHEPQMQKWIRPFLARGHVNVSVTIERDGSQTAERLPELDLERARRYRELLDTLGSELGIPGEVTLDGVARFGDLFRAPEPQRRFDVDADVLQAVTEQAARDVRAMREAEGQRLEVDLRGRIDAMAGHLDQIEARAPERLVSERERLRAAIRELADRDDVDEERLARELAYLADKWDISEELVRFRSHIELFLEALAEPSDEGVGKRLGFIAQEMHREANTIGSKANDTEIGRAVVGVKEELERLREQLENVE